MYGMLTIKRTILIQLKLTLNILSVFCGRIIFPFALGTLQCDQFNRRFFSHHKPPIKNKTASERNRTADPNLTMVVLCRLSYRSRMTLENTRRIRKCQGLRKNASDIFLNTPRKKRDCPTRVSPQHGSNGCPVSFFCGICAIIL